jgi:hypothetical protein
MQSVSGFHLRDGVFCLLAVAPIAVAPPAAADPIVVTEGIVQVDSSDPSVFNLVTSAFSIFAISDFQFSELGPLRDCFLNPCTPGMSFDTSAQITQTPFNSVLDFPGVELNGVSYPSGVIDGYIRIAGPSGIVPALEGEVLPTVLIDGMLLDALLIVYPDPSRLGTPLLTAQLIGHGRLGVRFGPGRVEGTVMATDVSYRFGSAVTPAPVPEPGTLFLVAAGAACLLKRRHGRIRHAGWTF